MAKKKNKKKNSLRVEEPLPAYYSGKTGVLLSKESVMRSIELLPEKFPAEIAMARILFLEKIEEGLIQAREGKTVPHEKVMERLFADEKDNLE